MPLQRPLLRRIPLRAKRQQSFRASRLRFSTKPPSAGTPKQAPSTPQSLSPSSTTTINQVSPTSLSRLQKLNDRMPKFVQRWTTPLLRAPASQVISFLLLHEATAVIPLFGLFGFMHYTSWMPPVSESKWIVEGVEKFGKYARRKGWLKNADVEDAEGRVEKARAGEAGEKKTGWWKRGSDTVKGAWQNRDTLYGRGESGVRILLEFATAYAVVKALIIPRLAFSVWATPWFARLAVEPSMAFMARRGGKLMGSKKPPTTT